MTTSILFHNVLSEDTFDKIGFSSQPFNASYLNEEYEEVHMSVELIEGQENTYEIVDPKVHWDPEKHDLNLQQDIGIQNPSFLFGEHGIVEAGAKLGVAFRWFSKDSSQRRVSHVGVITFDKYSHLELEIDVNIPKGTFRGRVTFEVILYLLEAGDYGHVVPGTVLGTLESTQMLFDGESSLFPIVEVKDPSKPLWWVTCDFDDPLYDQFSEENVSIVLNTGHKLSRNLKIEKGISSSPLLVEIIASGLQIIIEKVKGMGEWEQILSGESEHGSIGEAIYYFVNTFGWDTASPEKLARSIREDFDKRLK
ncbi:hypothetical protein QTG56_01465 [Rossellomorea sp. AcN35-11]|nr:hypothetical protein [Rossellomorea aquimaris]WJV29864.1 hypothetical protein QTG56_01465 [Rossellomorea sp. AcN35-11]